MSFFYRIYGLNIHSSASIGNLTQCDNTEVDLFVNWTTNTNSIPSQNLQWTRIITNDLKTRRQNIEYYTAQTSEGVFSKISFDTKWGTLLFLLEPGKSKLWILHHQNEQEGNLASFFVSVIMGCVLRLKGVVCLHASAVEINGKAVVLLGKKRSGKSTTAAAFAKLNYNVITDDIVALTIKDGAFFVEPGYSKLRLRPLSLAFMHQENAENFDQVYEERDSRYTDLGDNFCNTALPLGRVYMLNKSNIVDQVPFIEPLVSEALVRLHENTFASYVVTPDMRRNEFLILAQLANRFGLRRLVIGQTVNLVNLQCEAIIANCTQN